MLVLRFAVVIAVRGPLFFRVFPGVLGHWGGRGGRMGGGGAGEERAEGPAPLDVGPAMPEAASP